LVADEGRVLFTLLVGLALAGLLALILVNALRPDLFRFEVVGPTSRSAVLSALEARLALLDHLPYEQLAQFSNEQYDRVKIEGRDVLFQTVRTSLPDGVVKIAILAVVRERSGLLSRPIGVATRGFRITAGQSRGPLTDEELMQLAMNVSSQPFYER
jgi:hypothetical protein